MQPTRWFLHPIFIFVFSILALCLSLFIYIYSYVEVSSGLQELIRRSHVDPAQFGAWQTWVVIVVLSILVGLILSGLLIIFIYHLKTLKLFRLQENFINSFTHELKTPVTSLQLYLETFKKHQLPREMQLKYIDYMLADVSRLTEDINRILNLARIEARSYEGEFQRVDLLEIVSAFCRANSQLFRGCEIRIHNPSGQSFPGAINRPLFEMMLMNLISNAVRYNENLRPSIDITFMPQGDKLHISFEDNGTGFARSESKKIFRKFYQIERPDQPQGKGSGLGLYLVENIVRLHKGRIRASSRGVGQGARISIIWPLAKEREAWSS